MGEWMVQVPVKLDPETVARIDLLRGSYPFKPGRSTVIRELVEEGLRLISEGIMQFRAQAINRVPSVQSIPGTPEQSFPSALQGTPQQLGMKPPVRAKVLAPDSSHGRRGVSAIKRVAGAAGTVDRFSYPSSFPASLLRPYFFNSTRVIRRAA